MLGEKFRSRKLLLILAFLLIDTDSITNSLLGVVDRTTDRKSDNSNSGSSSDSNSNSDRSSSSSTTNVILDRTLWLLDENSGLCLGTEGFSECGDTNLWKWQSTGSDSTPANGDGLLLEVASISSKQFPETQEKECLGRGKRFRKGKRTLRKTSCAKFPVASLTSLSWRFDPAIGRLSTGGFVSSVLGTSCVQEDGSLSSCEDYAVLREVFVQDSSTAGVSRDSNKRRIDGVEEELDAEEMEEGLIEEGTWTDPVTNLQLPRNLDKALASTAQEESSPARRQVFMGGGVYKKVLQQSYRTLLRLFSSICRLDGNVTSTNTVFLIRN